jgi:hypothetical protein
MSVLLQVRGLSSKWIMQNPYLGQPLNDKDSVLGPAVQTTRLLINLSNFTISVPREKRCEIVEAIEGFISRTYISVRDLHPLSLEC